MLLSFKSSSSFFCIFFELSSLLFPSAFFLISLPDISSIFSNFFSILAADDDDEDDISSRSRGPRSHSLHISRIGGHADGRVDG